MEEQLERMLEEPLEMSEVSQFLEYLRWRPFGSEGRTRDRSEFEISTPDPTRPFVVLNPKWDDRAGVILGRPLAERLRVWKPRPMGELDGETFYAYDRVYLTTMASVTSSPYSPHCNSCVT